MNKKQLGDVLKASGLDDATVEAALDGDGDAMADRAGVADYPTQVEPLLQAATKRMTRTYAQNPDRVREYIDSATEGLRPSADPYQAAAGTLGDWLDPESAQVSGLTFRSNWTAQSIAAEIRDYAKVRVIGQRHADEPISNPSAGTLVVLGSGGPRTEPAGFEAKPGATSRWRWFAAGRLLSDMIPALVAAGLALENMGSFTFQTLGGAISCGTHGSGWSLGCMADRVRTVDLVTGDGELLRIEPTNGRTLSAPAGWRLVQDDALFRHAVVSVGLFGVVVGYGIELEPEYLLNETTELTTFEDAIPQFAALAEQHRHAELYINPYDRIVGNKHRALLILRDKVDNPETISQYTVLDRSWPRMRRRMRRRSNVRERAEKSTKRKASARNSVGMALRFVSHTTPLEGPWWDILRRDTFVRAHGFEVFVPADDASAAGEAILAAIDAASRFRDGGHALQTCVVANAPIGMRVIRSSDLSLAMTHLRYRHNGVTHTTEQWISFEVPRLWGTPNEDAIPRSICEAMSAAGVFFRTHWGQYAPSLPVLAVPNLYPEFGAFSQAQRRHDSTRRFVTPAMALRGF